METLSSTHVTHLKRTEGETLDLCLTYVWGQWQNNLNMPFGADKPNHQAASGAQTEALTPSAEGFIGLVQGLINLLLDFFSGSSSMLYFDSLSLLVIPVSVSVLFFVKKTVLSFCLWVSYRLRQFLSKEIFTHANTCQQTIQWQSKGIVFSLLAVTLCLHFYILQKHIA